MASGSTSSLTGVPANASETIPATRAAWARRATVARNPRAASIDNANRAPWCAEAAGYRPVAPGHLLSRRGPSSDVRLHHGESLPARSNLAGGGVPEHRILSTHPLRGERGRRYDPGPRCRPPGPRRGQYGVPGRAGSARPVRGAQYGATRGHGLLAALDPVDLPGRRRRCLTVSGRASAPPRRGLNDWRGVDASVSSPEARGSKGARRRRALLRSLPGWSALRRVLARRGSGPIW